MKKPLLILALILAAFSAYASEASFIEEGREAARKADLAFLWGSDTHHQSEGSYGAQKGLIDEFVSVANGIGVDYTAITGDIVNGYYNRESQERNLSEIREWLDGCKMPVMLTMGNHDDNGWFISGQASVKEIGSLDELFPKEDFFKVALRGHEKEFVRDPKNPYGGWYYKDFTKAKIRVIMLNSIDIPYIPKDKGLKYYGQWHYGFCEAQLQWLANKALRFSKKGWGVIVMTHNDYSSSEKIFDRVMRPVNGDIVEDLLEAFEKKGSGTFVSEVEDHNATVKYDFRRNASNEFIASFAGHRHGDIYDYVKGTPHILIAGIFDKQKGGFDLVTVNRKKRTISTRRYLNGEASPERNREFLY